MPVPVGAGCTPCHRPLHAGSWTVTWCTRCSRAAPGLLLIYKRSSVDRWYQRCLHRHNRCRQHKDKHLLHHHRSHRRPTRHCVNRSGCSSRICAHQQRRMKLSGKGRHAARSRFKFIFTRCSCLEKEDEGVEYEREAEKYKRRIRCVPVMTRTLPIDRAQSGEPRACGAAPDEARRRHTQSATRQWQGP
jgi:hypothetical protein